MTVPFDDSESELPKAPPPTYLASPTYVPPPPDYQSSAMGYPPPPPMFQPPIGQYPAGYGMVAMPSPYGFHPYTGEPLSDKSKTAAGLLQLFGLVGLLGIGRMYMGQTAFGVGQLIGCLIAGFITCGFGFIVPFIWGIVDAVVLMTGRPRDQYGRLLRDGT